MSTYRIFMLLNLGFFLALILFFLMRLVMKFWVRRNEERKEERKEFTEVISFLLAFLMVGIYATGQSYLSWREWWMPFYWQTSLVWALIAVLSFFVISQKVQSYRLGRVIRRQKANG